MPSAITAPGVIPGTENMPMEHRHSYERVSTYPVVKDTLAQAHTLVQSNAYSNALYERATALAASILHALEPLQNRLPLERVDDYANSTLDYVEKRFPQVKSDTKDLYAQARKPADDAAGLAKAYADGFQSRISPVTNELSARIAQGQETLHAIQERLTSTLASLPRDKQSATEAINSLFSEVEALSTYITNNAKEIPATAQAKAQPLIDGLAQATKDIKAEILKSDVPISTKASNILAYSKEQLTPLLTSIKDLVTKKKAEVATEVEKETPAVNGQ